MVGSEVLLDLAEAMRFRDENPPEFDDSKFFMVADISNYPIATPEAIEYLAKSAPEEYGFVVIEFESLDLKNAKALAEWKKFLCFTKLQSLDVEVAAILVESGNQLCFEGLKTVSPEVARELAMSNNLLHLELESLSIEIAYELARHSHELNLVLKTPPSAHLLTALSKHAGYRLHVTWVRQAESVPCLFAPTSAKKVFIIPRYEEEVGKWFENVYIGDADFYPDELDSNSGIIEIL